MDPPRSIRIHLDPSISNEIHKDPSGSMGIPQDPQGSIGIHQDPSRSIRIHWDIWGFIKIYHDSVRSIWMHKSLDPSKVYIFGETLSSEILDRKTLLLILDFLNPERQICSYHRSIIKGPKVLNSPVLANFCRGWPKLII